MKKGFTLIELLAVIVILAIIALIATPIILNIIGNAKSESNERTKELYLDAVKDAVARKNLTEEFNPSECTVKEDGNLLCGDKDLLVEVSGIKPCSGTITFDKKGKITNETVTYCDGSDNSGDLDSSIANAPELMDSLVPVIYNTDHWEIADTTSEWYDYDKQEWANAVILSDTGKNKTVGDTLTLPTSTSNASSSDVKAMFVWIPRYSYTISSTAGSDKSIPGAIAIKFVDKNTKENGSATYEGNKASNYYTHPAFTFGEEELSGIWVGKFETSAKAGSDCYKTESTANCNNTNQEPYILPNVPSLRYQTVSNQFETAKKFSSYISNSGDSHMMKNSEWGAVAYLSQSKYGKYGNDDYTGANKEVYQNKTSTVLTGVNPFITGDSSGKPGANGSTGVTCSYDKDVSARDEGTGLCGPGASTTGNIYGVYDMSGGANERVMGVYTKGGSVSGFNPLPDAKYFDAYTDTDENNVAYKGHALGETSGWYRDETFFVSSLSPWFERGGYYADYFDAGVFHFDRDKGSSHNYYSFRVVLSPTT